MALARVLLRRPDFTILHMEEDVISLDCARSENAAGAFTIVLPIYSDTRWELGPDYMVEVQRSFDGGNTWVNDMQTMWFVRTFAIEWSEGREVAIISGHDSTGLLDRRVVAWFGVINTDIAQNYFSIKSGPAPDAMREVVRENFTNEVMRYPEDWPGSVKVIGPQYRPMPSIVVEPDDDRGPIILVEMAWATVSEALREIVDACAEKGLRLIYDLVLDETTNTFVFKVWSHRRGLDRTLSTVFSLENGNIATLRMTNDYSQEVTWVHVGGEGQAAQKLVIGVTAQGFAMPTIVRLQSIDIRLKSFPLEDVIRDGATFADHPQTIFMNPAKLRVSGPSIIPPDGPKSEAKEVFLRTPFYPIETYVDSSGDKNDEVLMMGRGKHEMRRRAPRWVFAAQAQETPQSMFGRDYGFGDSVAVQHRGQTSLCRIRTFRLRYENGQQFVEIPLESEEAL